MPRRRGGRRGRRGGRRRGRRGNPMHFPLTHVPTGRSANSPVPPELDTTLTWYVSFVLTQATGSALSYAGVRFYTNSALSPDIVTPSNRPNGFTSMATLYGSYRVIGYSYEIRVISRETFSFTCMVSHTNTDPGTSSGQLANVGSANTATRIVNVGVPPVVFKGSKNIAAITGRPVENDDILAADVSTHPSDLTFLGIFLQAATETFTTNNGANISVTLRLRTRFFNRKIVSDAFARPAFPYVISAGETPDQTVITCPAAAGSTHISQALTSDRVWPSSSQPTVPSLVPPAPSGPIVQAARPPAAF